MIKGDIHHFVIQQLFAEVLRAKPEIAVGCGQQVLAKELLVIDQRLHSQVAIDALKFIQQLGIFHICERLRNIVLEKFDGIRQLLQSYLCEYPGRIAEVLSGCSQYPRNLLLAFDYRAQPLRGRREVATHDDENAVCHTRWIEVRVLPPHLNGLQFEQAGVDGGSQNIEVAR